MNAKGRGNMLQINIMTEGLSQGEQAKVLLAENHIRRAVNSFEFNQFVLNFQYRYTYYTGFWRWKTAHVVSNNCFIDNDGLSNREVYEKIMSGAETLYPEIDNEADMFLRIDRHNKRGVLGYTYPNSKFQYIYNWFFKKATYKQIAGSLVHEYCHKQGFIHDFKRTARRPYSVPYQVGNWIANYAY